MSALRGLFCHIIGKERCDCRSRTGQHTDDKAEDRTAANVRQAELPLLFIRQQILEFKVFLVYNNVVILEVAGDLRNAKQAHCDRNKVDAGVKIDVAEHELRRAENQINANACYKQTEECGKEPFGRRLSGHARDRGKAQHHQRKVFRRAKHRGKIRNHRSEGHKQHDADRTADHGSQAGHAECFAGLSLLRHRVTVERRHDRRGVAGSVDQDRGDRTAVHGTIVNAAQHTQRADRIKAVAHRQQHCDADRRAQSRECANDDAADHANKRINDRHWVCQNGKAMNQIGKYTHIYILLS